MHKPHTTLLTRTLLVAGLSLAFGTEPVAARPPIAICHWYAGGSGVLWVTESAVAGHFSHGDSYLSAWYLDNDGDGRGDAESPTLVCPAAGRVLDDSDCDDTNADVYPDNVESDDLLDNDCDLWVDEDFVAEGDVIITEVARQPRFGMSSTVAAGQWFELTNLTDRTVDMSYWYVMRSTPSLGTDAFFVDPDHPVVLDPYGTAVFCKSDDYEGSEGAAYPLWCDQVWGDDTQPASWHDAWHDNTFNLQRDADRLAMFIEGGSLYGRSIDEVAWSYTSSATTWPRVAARSMVLDPAYYDGEANDDYTSWCVAATDATYTWWVSDTWSEYGTPGDENPECT